MDATRPKLFNEYRPKWVDAFDEERVLLMDALGDTAREIHHIGSTSIPRMPGKGIIDILILVDALEPREAYDVPLRRAGYLSRPVPDRPESPFYTKPSEKPRTHNVHIAVSGSAVARNHILFRDYLRSNKNAFERYAAYKRGQITASPDEWKEYSEKKLEVASQILKEAQESFR
jgi:GrpB-like predicted nucleotidyltransferase (UPF0157 family)